MSSAIFHIQVYASVTKEEAVWCLLQKAQAVAILLCTFLLQPSYSTAQRSLTQALQC